MIAQRAGTTALRRVAAAPSSVFKLATPLALQTRTFQTDKLTPTDGSALLAKQRLSRPVSPHLDIYDAKQTWFGGSAWQRITGASFSGALYASAVAYLAAPLVGWHLESASLVAAAAALPVAVKGALKFLVAWPFVFHAINGVRHLAFDLGVGFARSTIIKTGWYFWGASIVGGLYLAFFM
ncbi:hypothetical protein QBC32DRAFT_242616 [Pseudoneurospora amorphoporcata]|uniref:Uncharacterized protein n=1 Tax=Pseudoneurospora amorphoporcata TaxID=241081 RepID=A0AAN6NRU7_9PEZI|nr:hypothetical protein QBC32DRAFT_242616 [Pseudoneurospora amorphoporcata]